MKRSEDSDNYRKPKSVSRRRFLRSAITAAAAAGSCYYAGKFEPNDLVVTHTDVHLIDWPVEADGLKIGVISDFHADYDEALERVSRSVSMLLAEKPDLVLLGGDYISNMHDVRYLKPTIQALAPVSAAPRGAYGIMGNHDCWGNNTVTITNLLEPAGVMVLENGSFPLPGVPGAYLVGLGDGWAERIHVPRALANVPEDAKRIVFVHEPDFADSIGPWFDLQLSGHSHGGQIRIPGLPVLHTPKYGSRYPEGLQQAKYHQVYTTRGIGMVGPQIRTFCPPEVTILTLRTKPSKVAD